MAVTISVSSMPASAGGSVKVPRKLLKGRERLMAQNMLGLLNQMERRDGRVSLAYKENDFRSQHMMFGTGLTGLTAAVNKMRTHIAALLAKTV